MEMVSNYLMLDLKRDKENLEEMIFSRYNEIKTNSEKKDYNVQNQIITIFESNYFEEGIEVTSLLEKANHYLNAKVYDEKKQKNLSIKIEAARQAIERI